MLGFVKATWEQLGQTEPHWSVLASPQFKPDRIADTMDDFYGSGWGDLGLFQHAAERCNVELPGDGTCFELGCGVGRVTIWLAQAFRKVIAADVSASHLPISESPITPSGRTNVEFRFLDRLR